MTFSKHLLPFLPTAQLVHGSTGYSVDTLRFHDEVTLFSSDGVKCHTADDM